MLNFVATRATKTRRSVAAALLLVACVSVGVLRAGRAHADTSATLVSMANSARESAGLAPLTVSADLAAAARAQASRMAASGVLAHTPNLPSVICCWSRLGENVGEATAAAAIQHAFMASPEHRANILSTGYTQIGVGAAVDAKGVIWVSEIFRRPMASAPAPPPTATRHPATQPPATTPAPAPPPRQTTPPAEPPAPSTSATSAATTPAPESAAPESTVEALRSLAKRASRDLPAGRLPLEQALRVAAALVSLDAPAPDPVSGLLDFAAITSTTSA